MANWRKTKTAGVYVARQRQCPAFAALDARWRCEPSWRARRHNPLTGKPEWQKPVTKDRSEALSWLAAARDGADHLRQQAAAGRTFETIGDEWLAASRRGRSVAAGVAARPTPPRPSLTPAAPTTTFCETSSARCPPTTSARSNGRCGSTASAAKGSRARAQAVNRLEREITELVTRLALQLLSEPGFGPLIAAKLVGEIAGAQRFATAAKLARAAGVAPISASSGNTRRQRLDQGGNRQINAALHRVIVTRARCHQPTRDYIARRRAEGRSTREAIRCLKRYLTRHVWRLLQPPHPIKETTPHINFLT